MVKFTDLTDSLDAENQKQSVTEQKQSELRSQQQSEDLTRHTIVQTIDKLAQTLTGHEPKVVVKNHPKPLETIDVPRLQEVVNLLKELVATETNEDYKPIIDSVTRLKTAIEALPSQITIPEAPKAVSVDNQIDYSDKFTSLQGAVENLELSPTITVPKPSVVVNTDLANLPSLLEDLLQAVKSIKLPEIPQTDFSPLEKAVNSVQETIASLTFPVPNYVLPFKDVVGKAVQASLDNDGNMPVMPKSGLLPMKWDDLLFTNADANGNYQTGTVKSGGATVATLTLAYDGSSNLTRVTRV